MEVAGLRTRHGRRQLSRVSFFYRYDGSLGPTVMPIFINEAAYYYAASGLGIMLTQAVEWPVPADLG